MDWLSNPEIWASLATLTALEIVLGIDNLIFISVITARLLPKQQISAQRLGLAGALVFRVAFLSAIVWLTHLTTPVFSVFAHEVSWRDIILLLGGGFLLAKATIEIHHSVEAKEEEARKSVRSAFALAVAQIMVLDLVFSIDSVITAVGMTDFLPVMIAAVAIAIAVMMFAAKPVGDFVRRHPTTKMLALSFLLMIGVALIADGLHFHIPRGYLYFAIAFSILVEALNLVAARRRERKRGVVSGGATDDRLPS